MRRESVEGRGSPANETRETLTVSAKETRDTRSPEAMASARAAFRRPVPGRRIWAMSGEVGSATMLGGRIAPNENAELRVLTAMELRMAAWAPAADMLFQSVEMVDMRLSTISDQRLRLSMPRRRFILMYVTMAAMTRRRGIRTAAAIFPWEEELAAEDELPFSRETSAAAGTGPDEGAE